VEGAERQPPDFVRGSSLLEDAFEMAYSAHHGPGREGNTDIDHPVAVAELLQEQAYEEAVVAAALLHDTVEDTNLTLDAVTKAFGSEIAALVAAVTENPEIEPYPVRKAEARTRAASDPRTAAIYAADKLAKTRHSLAHDEGLGEEKGAHYTQTLQLLSERHPSLPFLAELADELARATARGGRRPRTL